MGGMRAKVRDKGNDAAYDRGRSDFRQDLDV